MDGRNGQHIDAAQRIVRSDPGADDVACLLVLPALQKQYTHIEVRIIDPEHQFGTVHGDHAEDAERVANCRHDRLVTINGQSQAANRLRPNNDTMRSRIQSSSSAQAGADAKARVAISTGVKFGSIRSASKHRCRTLGRD